MRFHLNFNPQKTGFKLDHSHTSFLIGSCFSENIGEKLNACHFNILSNPGGNLFNPFSIYHSLQDILKQEKETTRYFVQRDKLYYSYPHHSSIHAASETELTEKINSSKKASCDFLKSCDFLFITFGTAYYYHHKTLNITVANCHKQNADLFEKRLAAPEEIVIAYEALVKQLKELNPKLKLIFTVSPVKHLKDGLIENTLSKSILLLSVHQLVSKHVDCFYFPAYELVTDDLRDYRFYKEDLAHPNHLAVNYVWEKFSECYFDAATLAVNEKIDKLNRALSHKPLHTETSGNSLHQQYISALKNEIITLVPSLHL